MTAASELRALSDTELAERLEDAKQELFELRFAMATGQLDDTSRLGRTRREVARVLTVQRERTHRAHGDRTAAGTAGATDQETPA